MSKKSFTQGNTATLNAVQLLVNVRDGDTVYADLYLHRARELLASVLSQAQYNALKGIQGDIDTAVKRMRVATASQDWQQVAVHAARVDELRRRAEENAPLSALGAAVYDTHGVSIDPFSPGLEFLPGFDRDLAERRDALVANLKALATVDPPFGRFYTSRRAFFAGLALASRRSAAAAVSAMSSAEIQQLAVQAAQQGDTSHLRLCWLASQAVRDRLDRFAEVVLRSAPPLIAADPWPEHTGGLDLVARLRAAGVLSEEASAAVRRLLDTRYTLVSFASLAAVHDPPFGYRFWVCTDRLAAHPAPVLTPLASPAPLPDQN
jgi:hypothetical protein